MANSHAELSSHQWLKHMFEALHSLQTAEKYCDVVLETANGEDKICMHGCILAAASPLLREHLSPHRPGMTVVKTCLPLDLLQAIVHYMYSARIESKPHLLVTAAQHLGVNLPTESFANAKGAASEEHLFSLTPVKVREESEEDLTFPCFQQIIELDDKGSCVIVKDQEYKLMREHLHSSTGGEDAVTSSFREEAACKEVQEEILKATEMSQQHETDIDDFFDPGNREPSDPEAVGCRLSPRRTRQRQLEATVGWYTKPRTPLQATKHEVDSATEEDCAAESAVGKPELQSVHDKESKSYPCEHCSETLASPQLRRIHRRKHRKQVHECSYCEKSFTIPYLRKMHIRKHHPNEYPQEEQAEAVTDPHTYPCEQCEKVFDSSQKRKLHRRIHRKKRFKCSFCDKTFAIQYDVKIHERQHTGEKPYACSVCDSSFATRSALTSHSRRHTGDCPFVCSFCSRSFSLRSSLTKHEATHKDVKPFPCHHCDKRFLFNSYRLAHEKKHSSTYVRLKPHKCATCQKAFSEKNQLVVHIRRKHTGETPYQCQFCPKMFASRRVLRNHEYTHRPFKPLKCPQCEKCFHTTSQLKTHQRTHTGEKPFQCNVCGKCFSQNCGLKHHMRTHTGERPFQCSYCDKRFSTKNKKEDHERVHTGDRPFRCSYCAKCFSQLAIQKVHERTHTGERPFKCSYCDWRSITKQHLAKHEKTHMKGKLGVAVSCALKSQDDCYAKGGPAVVAALPQNHGSCMTEKGGMGLGNTSSVAALPHQSSDSCYSLVTTTTYMK